MLKENFIEYLENSIKKNWELPAFSDYKGSTYYYKDVARKITRIHIMFEQCEVKKGDKIALLGKNSANWAMTYLSAITYGAVVVPILPDFHPNDMHHIINHSDSVILFAENNIWENLDEANIPDLRAIISLNDFEILSESNKESVREVYNKLNQLYTERYGIHGVDVNQFKLETISNKEIGALNYTSGTTGFSKGVMLPLNSLAANIRFALENMPLQPGDNMVSFLPLAHTYGCAFQFLWPFTIGCHLHFLTRTPSPKIITSAFKEIQPTLVIAVPLILEKIYKKQILPTITKKSLKALMSLPFINKSIYQKINKKLTEAFGGNFHEVVIGGAPLNADVEKFLRKIKFPLSVGYGMTECGPLISYANWDKTKAGSSGKLVDTLEIKIDSNDPYNEVGEILVRGENLMYGYYKNEEDTKKALDEEGWLHTGDLGIIDGDDFIFIKGRSKSVIIGPSGENIYPEEIESKLNNLPYVQESLILEKDNKLTALVYPDYEKADQEEINTEAQLEEIMKQNKKELNESLPKFKQISRIKLYPTEFEKTPKKSIRRFLYTIEE
ncbi:MAG: AMP-binding protein [Bacteroidales bacterium]|nr:AMP-binding protein [Bacteroidales bacterium]